MQRHFAESARVKLEAASACGDAVLAAASLISGAFRKGGRLYLCGNGGSAADCQHLAAEFMCRLGKDIERPALPAISLAADSSFLTAYTNDCGYDGVFARQIEGLGRPGDVLIGISTSGNSANVIKAFEICALKGISTIALCGQGGALAAKADIAISVPSRDTQHIQECHLAMEHLICHLVETELFPAGSVAAGNAWVPADREPRGNRP